MPKDFVLNVKIDAISWVDAIAKVLEWSSLRESRVVCICNVHSLVTARQDLEFCQALNDADIATPDGAPVAWMLRRFGHVNQERINGPDLMWRYFAAANELNVSAKKSAGMPAAASIFLYGSAVETLEKLHCRLEEQFPQLEIAGAYSPPYRDLSAAEDAAIVNAINGSGAGVVWVSLGCPKQEKWMAAHRGRIEAVMVGVGAAFDYHAGTIKRAPQWMQHSGFEWLYRLFREPRRLWKRYLVTNTIFVALATRQLLERKK